jgi:hypothetical protein
MRPGRVKSTLKPDCFGVGKPVNWQSDSGLNLGLRTDFQPSTDRLSVVHRIGLQRFFCIKGILRVAH